MKAYITTLNNLNVARPNTDIVITTVDEGEIRRYGLRVDRPCTLSDIKATLRKLAETLPVEP